MSELLLPYDELSIRFKELHSTYTSAAPFPHATLDNFLPEPILERVLEEFPGPDSIDWITFKGGRARKLATRDEGQMGAFTVRLLHELNSSRFLRALEGLTGIEGLIPDPHFEGGGLHCIERGGFLKIHADFNKHEKLKLDRRLNLLIYLNKDWHDEYGGHLELWDTSMSKCVKKILPVMNRCAVFSTTDDSYHGHPDPIQCPEGMFRRSIALYYYTNGRPAAELSRRHSTLYKRRPGERIFDPVHLLKTGFHETFEKILGRKRSRRDRSPSVGTERGS